MTKEAKDVLSALAEAVAHGLDDGWEQANRVARQPSREQRMDALYAGVMRRITDLVERNTK